MKYSERFIECVKILLQHEGGYVDDPDDAGGETKYGISKRAYPDIDIKNLTIDEAIAIYHRDYWRKIKGDQIICNDLAMQVFDMAVNSGIKTAVKMLQNIIGAYPDGIIGPETLTAIDKYLSIEGLLWQYRYERMKYYTSIVINHPKNLKFLKGWINRIEN